MSEHRTHVVMTANQQDAMALLCHSLRGTVKAVQDGTPINKADLVDKVVEWVLKFGVTPQDMDRLYEKFHRTGSNA